MPPDTISHYQLVAKIGSGGMGVVFKAIDLNLGREVALKILPEHMAHDHHAVERLRREARAASALNDPAICTIHEIDEADGTVFIAMELLEGETLAERLRRGRLPPAEAIDLGLAVAGALETAHARGVIHRDITPANIFLTTSGRVKVLDFGLAKLDPYTSSAAASGTDRTMLVSSAGQMIGTPAYMSPEQAKGHPIDGRTDLFSLGLVLHEALAGRRVFPGSTAEVMSGILTVDPPAISSLVKALPPDADRVLRKALEKDRELRYQTAAELRADLKRLKRDAGSTILRTYRSAPILSRRLALVLALVVVLAAAAAGVFWLGTSASRTRPVRPLLADATFTQLTDLPGLETFPSLSPDGQSFVFASAHEGMWHVYSQRVGGRNLINLTAGSKADDTQPAFSPDGGHIAFRSSRDGGGIFLMGATGESVRRLTDFGFNPAWSPDGSSIAVATELVDAPTSRMSYSAVWAVDVATGARRLVTDDDAVQPSWSPHNKRVAYWKVDNSGNRDIYTVPSGGGAPVAVTTDAATEWSPSWSVDGRYLFFSSDRGGSMNLWRVPIDEASGRTLGEPEPVTTPSLDSGLLSFSRDGTRMAYVAQNIARNIRRVGLDLRAERVGDAVAAVTQGTRYLRFPSVSPDGTSIAYTSDEKLMVSRVDGSGARQVTDGSYRDRAPRWSPDGETLLFYSNRTGTYEVWSVHRDGSGLQQITFAGPTVTYFFPTWSPDARRIAFGDLKGKRALLLDMTKPWAAQHPEVMPAPPTPHTFFSPWSWSPTGGLAGWAFRDDGQSGGLLIYDPAAVRYRQLTMDGSMRPSWLPDGRRLVAMEQGALWIVDARDGARKKLDVPGALDDEFTVSPDGSSIYFMQSQKQGDIWLVTLGGATPAAR